MHDRKLKNKLSCFLYKSINLYMIVDSAFVTARLKLVEFNYWNNILIGCFKCEVLGILHTETIVRANSSLSGSLIFRLLVIAYKLRFCAKN